MDIKEEYRKLCDLPDNANAACYRSRGFSFERVLNECLTSDELDPRSSYKTEGEQIDGSFFLDGSVFLLEAKWHKDQLPASSIYQFKGKVDGKLIGTIGVFISMSGYSKDAVDALTLGKSLNVILFGKEDIDAVINEGVRFKNILKSKLRKAAEEGIVYYSSEFEQVTRDGSTKFETFSYDLTTRTIVKHEKEFAAESDLIVICEGQTDREILSLLATKILNLHNLSKKINIIVAMGKYTIPRVANAARGMPSMSPVMIVTDSDGDIEKTKDMLVKNVELENWVASIPDPQIEQWLPVSKDDLRKSLRRGRGFVENLKTVIDGIYLDGLEKSDESFKIFSDWVKNA